MEQACNGQSVRLRHILCAVDLGPHSRAILDWTKQMAEEFETDMAIVHVIAPLAAQEAGDCIGSEWSVRLAGSARQRILRLQEDARANAETYIEAGDVPGAVIEAVKRLHADLLVIGRGSGEGLLGGWRANDYAILRESPCAVLSI